LEAKLDLSSRLAAISRLMGGVAHEIKNPLNSMAVHLEVLKSKLAAGEPEIEVITAEIRRLDRVVKTFLNFNRPVELQLKDFDLSGLARQTVALVAPAAREKNIRIEAQLDEPLLIRGDPDLLGQAILNVVLNGIEAMNEGGRLMLKSEGRAGECILTIADDGPGIPPDVQDKIFNLYFTTKKGGSGVGLALTFRMVQLHNGTIDFVTSQDTGTSFRMRFPEAVVALETNASTESNVVRV
jgi:signal transduction histidine kinase